MIINGIKILFRKYLKMPLVIQSAKYFHVNFHDNIFNGDFVYQGFFSEFGVRMSFVDCSEIVKKVNVNFY